MGVVFTWNLPEGIVGLRREDAKTVEFLAKISERKEGVNGVTNLSSVNCFRWRTLVQQGTKRDQLLIHEISVRAVMITISFKYGRDLGPMLMISFTEERESTSERSV